MGSADFDASWIVIENDLICLAEATDCSLSFFRLTNIFLPVEFADIHVSTAKLTDLCRPIQIAGKDSAATTGLSSSFHFIKVRKVVNFVVSSREFSLSVFEVVNQFECFVDVG